MGDTKKDGKFKPTLEDQERAKKKLGLKKHLETPYDEEGRVCTCCGEYKPWILYKGHTRTSTGRSSKCKLCYKLERKAKGRIKEQNTAKKRRKFLKKVDPILFKARTLRSRLLTRGSKAGRPKEETPTAKEIYDWFTSKEKHYDYYTGLEVKLEDCHIDHKQPLNRGGSNHISNLCITDSKVNSSKGAMTEKEFKELLNLVSTWEDKGEYLLSRLRMGYFGKLKG